MYDAVIVGGSHAGLSTACVLARAKREVLVVDSGQYRNTKEVPVHAFHTRDGELSTGDLLKTACDQLKKYPNVEIVKGFVDRVTQHEASFKVSYNSQQDFAKKIVLATGVRDRLPEIAGLDSLWGEKAFRCPYCDAWELKEMPLAVMGNEDDTWEHIKFLRNWSNQITLYTNGKINYQLEKALPSELVQQIIAAPIKEVKRVDETYIEIVTADLNRQYHAVFLWPKLEFQTALANQLKCDIQDNGAVVVNSSYETTTKGVYAVGDLVEPEIHMVALAVSSGLKAAFALNQNLIGQRGRYS